MSVKRFDQFEQNIKDALNQVQPQADEQVWSGIQSELQAGSASGFNWKFASFVSGLTALVVVGSIWLFSSNERSVVTENKASQVEKKEATKSEHNPESSAVSPPLASTSESLKESNSEAKAVSLETIKLGDTQPGDYTTESLDMHEQLSSSEANRQNQEGVDSNSPTTNEVESANSSSRYFEISVSELCEGANIECRTLTGKSAIWDMGDGNKLEGYRVMYRYLRPGNFKVQAFEQTADGKRLSLGEPVSVDVFSKPDPAFDVIPVSDFTGAETKFVAKTNSGQHFWRYGNGEVGEGDKSELRYRNKGFYQVKHIVISEDGCADSTVSNIRVSKGYNLLAQTVFNPSQSTWLPEGLKEEGIRFELKVYDLNGGIAFTSNSSEQAWNGSSQSGKVAREGDMFYWVAIVRDLEGKSEEFGGNILIISR